MRPTKRTQAVKKPRKRTTKRAVRGMEIGTTETPLAKLHKLKYVIDGVYDHRLDDTGKLKGDKAWVMEEITNLRDGGWLSATKMKVANEMWSKYAG